MFVPTLAEWISVSPILAARLDSSFSTTVGNYLAQHTMLMERRLCSGVPAVSLDPLLFTLLAKSRFNEQGIYLNRINGSDIDFYNRDDYLYGFDYRCL